MDLLFLCSVNLSYLLPFKLFAETNGYLDQVNNHAFVGRLLNVHSLVGQYKFVFTWLEEIIELFQRCCSKIKKSYYREGFLLKVVLLAFFVLRKELKMH